jgi:ATP-dependent exoDNAse (exonuclease V) alpha subunit
MLTRNLLYTAVTRAKNQVIIVTEPYSVTKSIQTLNTNKRKTALCEKIIESIIT